MSRRWESRVQARPLTDLELFDATYGQRAYRDRPMPGCQAACCWAGKLRELVEVRLLFDRLDWQLSGMDLVPISGALVGWFAVTAAVVRTLEVMAW